MIGKRIKFPWKVVFLTADGALPEERYTSENKAYLALNFKRELVREGSSVVNRAVVYEWDHAKNRWQTFEKHDLAAEIKETLPNRWLAAVPGIPDEVEVPGTETRSTPKGSRRTQGKTPEGES